MNHHEPNENFKYGVYARKSSEYEEAQIQSIQRQMDELVDVIDREGLVIYKEMLKESRSAFHPGREEFGKLVAWTNMGRINAWLCWHANRLSRNAVDAGTIVYLMDQGKLHHIRTRERIYQNTPEDKFMLQLEFTMSKKDSDDKSLLVKSGIRRRFRRGYPTGFPPVGYELRDQHGSSGSSFWVTDPPRFKLLKKVFTRFLQGNDSLTSIQNFALKLGLSVPRRKSSGGGEIARATIHRMLLNPVYAGFFVGSDGLRYSLDRTVPRVITEQEHGKISLMLKRRNSSMIRMSSRDASYRGLIRSSEGRPLGVDYKTQLICDCRLKFAYLNREDCPGCGRLIDRLKSPNYLFYNYYYSVPDRKSPGRVARVVEEKKIDAFMIEHVAERMAISRPLRDWAARYLDELRDEELRDRRKEATLEEQARQMYALKRKRLRQLYVSEQLTEEEYASDMADLEKNFEEKEEAFEFRQDWHADMQKILNLAVELGNVLRHGSPSEKRQALLDLRSNLVWDGKNLSVSNAKRVNQLIMALDMAKTENPAFEPENYVDTEGQNELFESVRPILSRCLDGVRTWDSGLPTQE